MLIAILARRWSLAAEDSRQHSDGIPEADNGNGEYLTTDPMLKIAKDNLDLSAEEPQVRVMQNISDFVGDVPQSDDITLMIVARDRLD